MYRQFLTGRQPPASSTNVSVPSKTDQVNEKINENHSAKPDTVSSQVTSVCEEKSHPTDHNIPVNQGVVEEKIVEGGQDEGVQDEGRESSDSESENDKTEYTATTATNRQLHDMTISDCWEKVHQQCSRYKATDSEVKVTGSEVPSAWKTVRLFVSSTFTDFFNEREILVKKVFPELREWCEEKHLHLVECDLRWGVPKYSTTRNTICTCLEEIDRCHAENEGKPFFLNMTGERYGWVPTAEDLSEAIIEQYQWVPDTSMTFMEVLHGAYRSKNPNAAFFLRDGEFCENIPLDYQARFIDKDYLQRKHVQVLKEKIRSRFPEQVFDYQCEYAGVEDRSGRKRVKLSGLDKFAEKVLEFFKSAILKTYPDQCNTPLLDEERQEAENQRLFMEKKSEFVIGRDDIVDKILSYARGEALDTVHIPESSKAFVRDPEFWQSQDSDNMILCLLGKEGYGKTTVLSKVVREAQKAGMAVFYHFVGCSPASRDTEKMYKSLVKYLTQQTIDDVPDTQRSCLKYYSEKVKEALPELRKKQRPELIVIDAVNELMDFNTLEHLSWLPPRFPGKVRCIVSTADSHFPTVHRLLEHSCYTLNIDPLCPGTAQDIITTSLAKFNKILDPVQMEMIISKPCVDNPLWVWLLTEELRIFGDFRTLSDKIHTVSDSVDSLLASVFRRLVSEDETGYMQKALCLIGCAKGGLPMSDILNVLGDIENQDPIPLLYWAKVRRLLKPYIRSVGAPEYINFCHSAMHKAVIVNFMSTDVSWKKWHSYLADYYLTWSQNTYLKMEAVPYHCLQADLREKLILFLRKDKASLNIPSFTRARYLQKYRCRTLADSVMMNAMPVVMCIPCSHKSAAFSPSQHFNKDTCYICGTWIATVAGNKVFAHVCGFHSHGQSKFMGKCVVCNMVISKNKEGKLDKQFGCYVWLCGRCSFGNDGKMCSFVPLKS